MDRTGFEPSFARTCSEMSVNITNSDVNMFVEAEDGEETDSSSSFDDSDCETEYPISDSDVVSHVFGDFFRLRTKKLTPQWKKYIQPLMWKCRWLELQIKKCNLQALKYDKELAAYNLRKNVESGSCSNEGFCSKSLPFSADVPRDKIMRRMKRIKIENRADMAPYVSNLILNEDGTHNCARMEMDLYTQELIRGDSDDEGDESLWLSDDVNDSPEGVFRKIEALKSRINNMRTRVNKAEEEEKMYNDTLKKEINDVDEDLIQSTEKATDDEPITVLDEPEQPDNNEPAPKIRSLAQIIAPKRSERIEKRRASSSLLDR